MRASRTAQTGVALLALVFCLAGCLPDLSPWQVGERTDGGPVADGGTPRSDGSQPSEDGCAPTVTCEGGCPLPWVLGAAQDLDNDRTAGCGGRVYRWSVQSQDEACACEALDAGGRLNDVPFAVGFAPPSTVVVGGEGWVSAIDANTDAELWSADVTGRTIDILPIHNPEGQLRVIVASGSAGGERASTLTVFEPSGGTAEAQWFTSSDLGISSFRSATVSPLDRRWMRILSLTGAAAMDFDPWNRQLMNMPPHTSSREGYFVQTISAAYSRNFHQTVWAGPRTDLEGQPSRVQRVSLVADTGDNRLGGGDHCQTDERGFDYDVECQYTHAIPDPTRETASFALCEYGSGQRRLVRLQTTGGCQTLVETAVSDQARVWRLALAQPSYWAP
ncbi:MAG: hypothetical protein AB8I08_04105 [Sandaracinaceae bacterium]